MFEGRRRDDSIAWHARLLGLLTVAFLHVRRKAINNMLIHLLKVLQPSMCKPQTVVAIAIRLRLCMVRLPSVI